MDRRITLSTFLGRKISRSKHLTHPSISNNNLAPYTGEWNFEQASHLLRRTMFGPKKAEIEQVVALGLSGTIDLLFQKMELPNPPLNYNSEIDPEVTIGET